MNKNSEQMNYPSEVLNKNEKIDRNVIENVNKLRKEAKFFGFEQKTSYGITPTLGNQLLFSKVK